MLYICYFPTFNLGCQKEIMHCDTMRLSMKADICSTRAPMATGAHPESRHATTMIRARRSMTIKPHNHSRPQTNQHDWYRLHAWQSENIWKHIQWCMHLYILKCKQSCESCLTHHPCRIPVSSCIFATLKCVLYMENHGNIDTKWYTCILVIGSMYAIYGNIYHQYTPNVSIYTMHGSYGSWIY